MAEFVIDDRKKVISAAMKRRVNATKITSIKQVDGVDGIRRYTGHALRKFGGAWRSLGQVTVKHDDVFVQKVHSRQPALDYMEQLGEGEKDGDGIF